MSFEDSETIANIHPKIRTFLQGTSPACIESDAASNCVRWDEISSWTSMGKWVDQSIISPIWGDYGDGELGVILQYLSVGKQLVFWTRRYVRARYARARFPRTGVQTHFSRRPSSSLTQGRGD